MTAKRKDGKKRFSGDKTARHVRPSVKNRSIARRLTLGLIVTVGIVSVIVVGLIYMVAVGKARKELEKKADEILAYQIGALEIPLWNINEGYINVIGKTISQNEPVVKIVIKDGFGRVAYSMEKENLVGSVDRAGRIFHRGWYVGEVFISLTTHFYEKNNQSLLFSFGITIAIILITIIIFSGLLIRLFLKKPLDSLNRIVNAYAAKQYDYPIHEFKPYIEFQPFSQVLIKMGGRITRQLRELRKAEEKYRSIFENAIEGIFQSTPQGRFLSVNPSMAQMMGYASPDELLFSPFGIATHFYVHPGDRLRFCRLLDEKDSVFEFEAPLYRKDATRIIVSISARNVRDANGKILYYEGFMTDITKRKQALEALKQTKEHLAMLLESLPIVPYTCWAEGNFGITYVSRTIEEITGYKPEQFISDSSFWADHIAEEDRRQVIRQLPRMLEKEKGRYEYRFKIADGSYRWFDDIRRVIPASDGSPSHIAGTWRDITEEKRLQQQAEYRLQQVIHADKLASLGEVVAGVAHEINNPNSFITCNAPLLAETWQVVKPILEAYSQKYPQWHYCHMTLDELCEDMKEIIQAIRVGSERINKIVVNLKDFVRLDDNPHPGSVDLNQVIEKTFAIIGTQVRKSVKISQMYLEPELPAVQGYFQKMEQVLTNLVINAVHAIGNQKEGRITIRTRYIAHHHAVILQVEDNGSGMPPEVVERIFEPFFTTRRNSGGTGLGLSVSYNLVKEQNGILAVLSRPGVGSRFTVFLPVDPDVILELHPATLYIGEDADFSKVISACFDESANMKLFSVRTTENAINCLHREPEIDRILMESKLLMKNQWDILYQIKKEFPLLTVILCADSPEALKQKPDHIPEPDLLLQKPFHLKAVEQIIGKTGRQKL